MFERLQILLAKNWGMPYHFIFAYFLMFIVGRIFNPAWIGFGIIIIATIYEVWQFKKGNNNSFDFATDMIANMLGVIMGAWSIYV